MKIWRKLSKKWGQEQSLIKDILCADRAQSLPEGHCTKYLVGMDISMVKGTAEGVCTAILLDYEKLSVLDSITIPVIITEPYIAGFLAFRELPHYLRAFKQLQTIHPTKVCRTRTVVIIDGNGMLHPNRCGLASHFGVTVDMPTVGCSKNLHQYGALSQTRSEIKELAREHRNRSEEDIWHNPITDNNGTVHGYAVCASGVVNPIYISRGYMVSDTDCLRIAKHSLIYREPEPIRLADRMSREHIRCHAYKTKPELEPELEPESTHEN